MVQICDSCSENSTSVVRRLTFLEVLRGPEEDGKRSFPEEAEKGGEDPPKNA